MNRAALTLLSTFVLASCAGDDGDDQQCIGACGDEEDLEIAGDLPAECSTPDVIRIERPSADDGRDTFQYGFRFKAATAAGAPVLVYLPGGPGQSSMDQPAAFIPAGWGYLMTDPRGVGCNRLAALPTTDTSGQFFTTEQIADDVIAAIEDRGLDNYVLFGISYGSALGTTVAHHIEDRGVAPPIAVVLEGVLGRTFGRDDTDFPGAEYITQWQRIRPALPADVLAELDTQAAPYGLDATAWSKVLMGMLPMGPLIAFDTIAGLSSEQPPEIREQALATLQQLAASSPMPAGATELYRQVACREIMDTVPANDLDVVFQAGQLVRNRPEEGTKCRELHVTTPYDSAALPFTTQLYLFIGDSDTATPPWQGAYHFEHHAGPVVRVVTRYGGHNSLELNQADCAPQLMASIAAGGADLATAAATCPMETVIDSR